MALVLSKIFMRQISQTHTEDQTGISLWTLADIKKAQAKQRALEFGQEQEVAKTKKGSLMDVDDDDEYGDGGLSDHLLGEVELDIRVPISVL